MPRRFVIFALLIIAAAGAGWFYWSAAPPTASAVPVVAQQVKSGGVPIYLSGIGTVYAYNTVVVRSQITGQIVSIVKAKT
jgi:membrane fusion protein, multidrug efflux system